MLKQKSSSRLTPAVRTIFLMAVCLAAGTAFDTRSVESVAPEADDLLPRLLGTLSEEPLAWIAVRDARTLADKYYATSLGKMIGDPSYERGGLALESKVMEVLGVSVRAAWPGLERNFSGPVILALMPPTKGAAAVVVNPNDPASVAASQAALEPPMRLVLLVLSPTQDQADILKQQWPKPFSPNAVLGAASLKIVTAGELPTWEKMPAFAGTVPWPRGEILVRALPLRLAETAKPFLKSGAAPVENLSPEYSSWLGAIQGSGIDGMTLAVAFKEDYFTERLIVDVNEEDSAFKRLTGRSARSQALGML